MAHWKKMMDNKYIYACDLDGKDVTLTIDRVEAGVLDDKRKGKTAKKPFCFFRKAEKPLVLNATNCKTIAGMYGNDTDAWVGRRITLYPTTTEMGGESTECIRVRPVVPPDKKRPDAPRVDETPAVTVETREPGSDG